MEDASKPIAIIRQVRTNAQEVNSSSRERALFIGELVQKTASMEERAADLASANTLTFAQLGSALGTIQKTRAPVEQFSEAVNQGLAHGALIERSADEMDQRLASIKRAGNLIADIAETTRMLALNASIEASRAGRYGAGFEVIANEVRSLSDEVEGALGVVEDSLRELDTTNEALRSAAEALTRSMKGAETGAKGCAGQLSALSGSVAQEVRCASDRSSEIASLTDDLAVLYSAICQIENNTQSAVSGSAQNVELCLRAEEILTSRLTPSEDFQQVSV